jgi:hypothetical protein
MELETWKSHSSSGAGLQPADLEQAQTQSQHWQAGLGTGRPKDFKTGAEEAFLGGPPPGSASRLFRRVGLADCVKGVCRPPQ